MEAAGHYTYFLVHVLTLIGPLSRSFEPRIRYVSKWKYLFPALCVTAFFFLVKDYFFTKWGIWSFNPEYLSGVYLANLPVEEVLFFFTVPFACVFIYEVLNLFVKKDVLGPYSKTISTLIIAGCLVVGFSHLDKTYTVFYTFTTAIFLFLMQYIWKAPFMGRFYLAYLVHLFPFFIINGILTALPVVMYNHLENLGIRIGTIPIEDTLYSMLLLGMNIAIYELLKGRAMSIKR